MMGYRAVNHGVVSWQRKRVLSMLPMIKFSAFAGSRTWVTVEKILELAVDATKGDLHFLALKGLIQYDKTRQYIRLLERGRRALED